MARHVVNSACFYFVCTYDHSKNRMWSHVGEDSIYEMIIELSSLADECIQQMKENQEMKMTDEDELNFKNATCCHICKRDFKAKEIKVRDHCHRTGKSRGAAHDRCNITYFQIVFYL